MQSQRTVHKQLIDQNKEFKRQAIESSTKTIGPVGRQYHTVAIIGVQNSGKSTLLNFLFGTNFEVLHEIAGTRTTRGIWTSVDKQQNIIVFDVEGNDSMDRAEEQDFQKMVATYSLVTAQVLIINVWSKTIGQYSGTQYETLRVIMDICITQFKQQSPKTILFCVRDFNDQYDNQGECRRKIVKDVNDIWRKIQKPVQLQAYNQKPQKFFTIQVAVLKKYRKQKPQKFIEDVNKLRQKFINPKVDGYVFAKQKTEFNLPISDLPQLTENAWNAIKSNKKLNLPNEKDQLANFRCSQIMTQIQHSFQQQLRDLNQQNLIIDLGKLRQKYLQKYHQLTYHYAKSIADEKLKQLQNSITDQLKKISTQKLNLRTNQLIKQFQQQTVNFSQQKQQSLELQMNKVLQVKIQQLITYMKHLNFEITDRKQRIDQLTKKLKEDMKEIKNNFLKTIQDFFQNQSSKTIRLLASQLIRNNFGLNFWTQAKKQIEQKGRTLIENYRSTFNWVTGSQLSTNQYGMMQQKIRTQSKQYIKTQLQHSFKDKILDQFKLKFGKDQNGNAMNYNLKTEQQISQHFDKARQYVIDLISKMNQYNQVPRRSSIMEDIAQQNSLFDSIFLSKVNEEIDKQMINQYEKVIRRKKQGEMNEVPWWMFLLIFYFVYDDIWFTEEDSPIIHYTLVVVLLVAATLFAIGQGKVVKQTIRIVTDKLKQKIPFLR